MSSAHHLNIALHVASGCIAMTIGFLMLMRPKGTAWHRRWGRLFVLFTGLVCGFAALGLALFRFLPLFAVLTVLVSYQLVSGWHVIFTQARGPSRFDAAWTLLAALAAAWLMRVSLADAGVAPVVVWSTLGALATLLVYDTARWVFPRHWHALLWRYEHIYKLLSALFGMVSALVGNVVQVGQPWSQLLPSALGLVCIAVFFVKQARTPAGRAVAAD
ncbi:hypothetical protein [Ideonella sp.]|uniref:hypothetical protein n=1 Tax=Ideonella sp. TaxID=1929293 RepID=UPI003BB617B7